MNMMEIGNKKNIFDKCLHSQVSNCISFNSLGSIIESSQTPQERYGIPENFLEIEVIDPKIQFPESSAKYVDYAIVTRVWGFYYINVRQIYRLLNSKSLL